MNGETDPFATRFHEIRFPNRGMNTQLPENAISDRELSFMWNTEVYPGGFRTIDGVNPIGIVAQGNWPLAGTLKYLDTVVFANGARHLIAITTTHAYRYDLVDNEWDDITPVDGIGAGTEYNYTAAYMRTEAGTEDWFFANGGKVLKYDATDMTVLLGAETYNDNPALTFHTALAVVVAWRRLWLIRTTEGGVDIVFRTRYSEVDATDLEADWPVLNYVDVDETPDEIMGGLRLGDALAIYKQDSIHTIQATTNPDYPFRKAPHVNGFGICSPAAVCNTPLGHFFVDYQASNVWLYNGMGLPVSKGDRVLENAWVELTYELAHRISVMSMPFEKRVYVGVPTYYFPGGVYKVNYIYAYDWRLDAWMHWHMPVSVMGKYSASAARTWDDMVGTWDAQTGDWQDELGGRPKEQLIIGDGGGYTYLRTETTPVHTFVGYSESGSHARTGYVRPEPLPMGQLFEFREVQLQGDAAGGSLILLTDIGQTTTLDLAFSGSKRFTFSLYGTSLKLYFARAVDAAERFDITRMSIGYGVRGQRGPDG